MEDNSKIILWMACGVILLIFGYLYCVTFLPVQVEMAREIVTPMLTLAALMLGYYWGSSKGSADKSKTIATITNGSSSPKA